MSFAEIKELRSSKRYNETIELGMRELSSDANSSWDKNRIRQEVEWAYYYLIKDICEKFIESKKTLAEFSLMTPLNALLADFSNIAQFKGMPLSNTLWEISKLGDDYYNFPGFIDWIYENDALRDEDWKYREFCGMPVKPIAYAIAVAYCKWILNHYEKRPEALERTDVALRWRNEVSERIDLEGDHALWLDWAAVKMLRAAGRSKDAAELIKTVLKSKGTQPWAWHTAGLVYFEEDPELAKACLCKALLCQRNEAFSVKIHRDLANLLAVLGDTENACREVNITVAIREGNDWNIDSDEILVGLMNEPWYAKADPDMDSARAYYEINAGEASQLCFDRIESQEAVYAGTIEVKSQKPHNGELLLATFAMKDEGGESFSLAQSGINVSNLRLGEPVTLLLGKSDSSDFARIVQIEPRTDGEFWDACDKCTGAVTGIAEDGTVFIYAGLGVKYAVRGRESTELPPKIGEIVTCFVTMNPKKGAKQGCGLSRDGGGGLGTCKDIRIFTGKLQTKPGSTFAFADDAYIRKDLLDSLNGYEGMVSGVAIKALKKNKDGSSADGWQAITVKADDK